MEKIRATQLTGLEKFAGVVFEGAQGKYTLDEYSYFDDTSLFSTAGFGATGAIAAGTEQPLFNAPVGAIGQGIAAAMTLADTNLERGWDGGKAPANQAYVATQGGFEVFCWNNLVPGTPVVFPFELASDLHQVLASATWSWNVGGEASPRLRYEPIIEWPIGAGITGTGVTVGVQAAAVPEQNNGLSNGGPVSKMRKFTFPLFFPPNVAVDCRVRFARLCTLTGTNTALATTQIRVAMHLRGYKLSKLI